MTVEALEAHARDRKVTLDALAQELRGAKQAIIGLAHNPLDVAVQKFLIPAALSIIRGMRSHKQEG